MTPLSFAGYAALACSLAVNFWALYIAADIVLKDHSLRTDRRWAWFFVAALLTPVNMIFVHNMVGQGAAQ